MRFGILQRYVASQVLRSFALALLTITAVFVLLMVAGLAASQGLAPSETLRIVPFVIPVSLPYTVPVAMLFAVSVVYSRLAADNEVIAVKTSGQSALTIIWPSAWLGLLLSLILVIFSSEAIPRANDSVKKMLFNSVEEMFYKWLKRSHEFNNPHWPFLIQVQDIDGKTMINATFSRRTNTAGNPDSFDMVINAKKAWVKFLPDKKLVRVTLEGANTSGGEGHPFLVLIDGKQGFDLALPSDTKFTQDKKAQEMTLGELTAKQRKVKKLLREERQRQSIAAALWIGSGRINRVDWPGMLQAYTDYRVWEHDFNDLETEKHMRMAMAWGSIFFVLLGAPVGILFARRDFLSAFMTCFLPIILIYYPLVLGMVNLGKEGVLDARFAWSANVVLGILGVMALRPVRKR